MDEVSVTRPAPPSTKAIVADEAFCTQAAAMLFCDRGVIHDTFIGEPAEEVLEMVRWALSHEDDEGFDAAEVLTAWAKKRGRVAWSDRPPRRARTWTGRKTGCSASADGGGAPRVLSQGDPGPGAEPRLERAVLSWLPVSRRSTTRRHTACSPSTRGPTALPSTEGDPRLGGVGDRVDALAGAGGDRRSGLRTPPGSRGTEPRAAFWSWRHPLMPPLEHGALPTSTNYR
jgi:hypothetical protein